MFPTKAFRVFEWRKSLPAFLVSFAFGAQSFACESVRTPVDYLRCVRERNPEIVASRAEAESAEDLKEQSARWLNPELQSEHLFGQTLGDNEYEHQVGLLQTFELGGKRGARIAIADARVKKTLAERDSQISGALGEGLIELLRTFQIREEVTAVDGAIAAYKRMVANLGRRSVLSPDQRSTVQLFQANLETLEDSRAALLAEQRILRATLGTDLPGIQVDWVSLDRFSIVNWPELSDSTLGAKTLDNSTILKGLAAVQELVQAEFETTRAEAWPDLKLGPLIRLSGDGPIHSQAYGLGLSIGLPVWDARAPAKRAAQRLIEASQYTLATRRTQQELLLKEKRSAYQGLLERILDRSARESFERYIGSVEAQHARGALGPTQVIEAYRQRVDGLRSRFEIERSALSLLLEIWTSTGELPEQSLAWTGTSWKLGTK